MLSADTWCDSGEADLSVWRCMVQDPHVHLRAAARMILRARRASVVDSGLEGMPPEVSALLRLPEDSPGGVVTASQLQQHAAEVAICSASPLALNVQVLM